MDIEKLHTRVRTLIPKAVKIVSEQSGNLCENSGKISFRNQLRETLPCNALVNTAQNPAPSENGNGLQVESLRIESQHTPERNMQDLLMRDGGVSNHGKVNPPHSEMIESTDHFQVGGLYGSVDYFSISSSQFYLIVQKNLR